MRSHSLPTFIQSDEHAVTSELNSSSSVAALFGKRRVESAFTEFTSQDTERHTQQSDLDSYLKDLRVPLKPDKNFDVVGYWKRNADVYLVLSVMAEDFLVIHVSTMYLVLLEEYLVKIGHVYLLKLLRL